MRPIDSCYDRMTSGHRDGDPGEGRYALVVDHNGPCSETRHCTSLDEAVALAKALDTDDAPTDLEDEIGVDASDETCDWLIEQAESQGWRVVATAPAGEYWTVLYEP